MEYRAVNINDHQKALTKKRVRYDDYETAILLKSRLVDMLKEFSEEFMIYYDDWFIVDKGPNRIGRLRSVICFIIRNDERQISKTGNLTYQLQNFFGYPDNTDIWKICTHVQKEPYKYKEEIRLIRYFLIKHKVITDASLDYYLVNRVASRKLRTKTVAENQVSLF